MMVDDREIERIPQLDEASSLIPQRLSAPVAVPTPAEARTIAWTLGALLAFPSVAIDMYLPAFSRVAKDLNCPLGAVQVTLAAFMLGLAFGQFFWGTLSDRVGRRRPLITGSLIFLGMAAVCAMTHSIHIFIAARLCMGFGGSASVVISRAVVRDLFEEREAAKFYSMMMIVTGMAPIVAPSLGGLLLTHLGWRAIFWVIVLFVMVCMVAVLWNVPETLTAKNRAQGPIGEVFRAYGKVLVNRRFLGPALVLGCGMGILFTYIASSSFVFIEVYGVPLAFFGLLFATNAIGVYVGGQSNRWLLRRFSSHRLLNTAVGGNVVATLLLAACAWTRFGGFPMFFGMLFLSLVTFGVMIPNAMATTMQPFPDEAGTASAVLGIVQFVLGAVGGALVGVFHNGTAMPMAIQIACFALISAAALFFLPRTETSAMAVS
jgi:DHA1 family bicyclomycin/chloramphenicol resistance-like MFS transporter